MKTNEKENFNYCSSITEHIVNDKTGVFDEVYYVFIYNLIQSINESIIKLNIDYIFKSKDKVLISLGKCFKEQLTMLLEKTLISELYLNKEKLEGSNSKERYDYFVNTYMKENYDEIFKESSIINRLIEINIKNTSEAAHEFFERFSNDANKIQDKFNLNIKQIDDVKMSCGDTHNNGRTVFLVYLNDGEKILYKPHTLKNDYILENLMLFINEKQNVKHPLKAAISLDCGDYGWQKFIKFKECKSEEEVKGYMYRLGSLICLSYILKTNDLHFENIIASGEYPIIIDSETLSYNGSFYRSGLVDKFGGIVKIISDSVYSSILLPQNLELDTKKIELSAIGGGYKDQTYTVNTVVNEGTDEIQFGYEEKSFNSTQEIKNIVTLNGSKVIVTNYCEDIIEGFRDYYNVFLDNKDEILNYFSVDENFDGEYRQVLRATSLYAKYLGVSYHPYYTASNEMREKVFNCLNPKSSSFQKQMEVVEAEKNQLRMDDVPYFYAKYNSLDLYTHTAGTISNFYSKTIKEIITERIEAISKDDCIKQEILIKYSLCGINEKTEETESVKRVNEFNNIDNSKEGMYKDLMLSMDEYLNKYHSSVSIENQFYSFFNLAFNGEQYLVGNLKPVLYESIGIVLYYMNLWKFTGDEKYKVIAERMINALNAEAENVESKDFGVFSGQSALIYLNYNAYKMLDDAKYYKGYKEVLHKLENVEFSDFESLDVTSGLAGIVIMLINIYEADNNEEMALNMALRISDELLKKVKQVKTTMNSGFAHGLAGISAALIMAFYYSNETKYYEESKDLFNIENKYYLEKENNWLDLREEGKISSVHWCFGPSGILVSRLIMASYVKDEDKELINRDIDRCISKIIDAGLGKDMLHNLCHGSIGNLDILLEASKMTNNEELYNIVSRKTKEIITDIIEHGVNTSNPVACLNVDFMTGLTGVMYFLLRFIDKDMPSVLFLKSAR